METTSKIKSLCVALSILFVVGLKAQDDLPTLPRTYGYNYHNAIGLRLGGTSGITYKHLLSRGNAFEGILGLWPYKAGITALYEKHFETGAPGLRCYVGGGGHLNIGETDRRYYVSYDAEGRPVRYTYRDNGYAMGIDGIMGVEYKFKFAPLALSADVKPFVEMNDYAHVYLFIDPSLGVKFAF